MRTRNGPVYRVGVADAHAHLWAVELTVPEPAAGQIVSLPVWIPGSYLVREFARHLQGLQAQQGRRAVSVTALDKCSWRVDCQAGQPLVLRYQVYAFDRSVRTAWLDAQRGFFNGTSLCLRVHGQEDRPHILDLRAPAGRRWHAACALPTVRVNAAGFGRYRAAGYDELVDNPVELGAFHEQRFEVAGIPHRLVISGAPAGLDAARLLADTQAICEAVLRFWHPAPSDPDCGADRPPLDRYLFLLNLSEDGYGGLEHRHGTALLAGRHDLPRLGEQPGDGYTTLRGLICHEYFHNWCVKRLRPTEFLRYDYTRENHTRLLWFFEGFTSYYDDLLLRRARQIDDATYLKLLGKTINQLQQTPGRRVQSVAEASFDAWTKYYRPDENTPNATVSYYGKGSLVALCFDLSLRAHGTTLDEVMRLLWRRIGDGGMTEADFAAALREVSGRDWSAELAAWVHGTDELPLKPLLAGVGVDLIDEPAAPAQRLGLRVTESDAIVRVTTVLRGGPGEQAGFAAGDEWLAVETQPDAGEPQTWRLRRLDDLSLLLGPARRCTAWVARDGRLLKLPLALPSATTWRLVQRDATATRSWLEPG